MNDGITLLCIGLAAILLCLLFVVVLLKRILGVLTAMAGEGKAAPQAILQGEHAARPPAQGQIAMQPIKNRPEFVAAVSAAIATAMGTPVERLRIHSIKRVGQAAMAAAPNRQQLVAVIAACIAEQTGMSAQSIRIHSIKKISA